MGFFASFELFLAYPLLALETVFWTGLACLAIGFFAGFAAVVLEAFFGGDAFTLALLAFLGNVVFVLALVIYLFEKFLFKIRFSMIFI